MVNMDENLFRLEMFFVGVAKKVDRANRVGNREYSKYFTPYLNGIVDCIAILRGEFDKEDNHVTMDYLCRKWFTVSQPEKPDPDDAAIGTDKSHYPAGGGDIKRG